MVPPRLDDPPIAPFPPEPAASLDDAVPFEEPHPKFTIAATTQVYERPEMDSLRSWIVIGKGSDLTLADGPSFC